MNDSLPKNVVQFLAEQFPEQDLNDLRDAFGPAYLTPYQSTPPKWRWEERKEDLLQLSDEIERIGLDAALVGRAKEIQEILQRIPPAVDPRKGAADWLRDHAELESAWHRCNPKTGGTDPMDHIVGDLVRLAFEDLNLPITFGKNPINGGPSTRFGRVIEHALLHNGSEAHWFRIAERARKAPRA